LSFIYIDGNLALAIFMLFYLVLRTIVLVKKKPSRIDVMKELRYFLFVLYMSLVVSITLFPIYLEEIYQSDNFFRHMNLIPFKTVLVDISQIGVAYGGDTLFMVGLIVRNVLGNIVLLIPFGFLAPMIWKKLQSFKHILLWGFVVSFSIETLQFLETLIGLERRVTDVDDLICNVIGTVIGYLVFIGFKFVINKLNIKLLKKLVT
jgi:glycopeptide antibiotics resistance protein